MGRPCLERRLRTRRGWQRRWGERRPQRDQRMELRGDRARRSRADVAWKRLSHADHRWGAQADARLWSITKRVERLCGARAR